VPLLACRIHGFLNVGSNANVYGLLAWYLSGLQSKARLTSS
jgi:hypothetical protein